MKGRLPLKCDGTRAETRFRLSAKSKSPFKSEVCALAVVMLDTPSSKVVWRVPAAHSIHQVPLYFPSRASPCAITFQLDSTAFLKMMLHGGEFHVKIMSVRNDAQLNVQTAWQCSKEFFKQRLYCNTCVKSAEPNKLHCFECRQNREVLCSGIYYYRLRTQHIISTIR